MPGSAVIHLDESGDLGWKFDKPYRGGGSSRYLTITAVCCPEEKKHLPARAIKNLYQSRGWNPGSEKKWTDMGPMARTDFANLARDLADKNLDVHLHAIVVKKQNVLAHIRADANKLYNYMIRLALLDRMAKYDVVTMVPDPRSIKVESGNSLHDYLQTELWFTKKATTNLVTRPQDSQHSKAVQFADMLAGLVQSRYEDNATADFQLVRPRLIVNQLFF